MAVAAPVPGVQQALEPLSILFSHESFQLPCLVKACGADFGEDHAKLVALLSAAPVTTFGSW
jgi:hypothetical protein